MLGELLRDGQVLFFSYTVALFSTYAALVTFAAWRFRHKSHFSQVIQSLGQGPSWPPVTVILPAYAEEAVIVHSARLALALEYPKHRVIVVCDGSKDRTFEVLLEAFDLVDVPVELQDMPIPTRTIRRCLATADGKLTVVYKDNAGKGDALNAGINLAKTPYVCCVDADTLLARDALKHLALEAIRDPYVIAVSGSIRLAQHVTFTEDGFEIPRLPRDWTSAMQLLEYTRAFYMSRAGLDPLLGIVLISGAFGLFSRHAIVQAGGYSSRTQGEDFELVVRLRKLADVQNKPYKVTHAPAAMAWTEAPGTLGMLRSQRTRWHRGLLQTLAMHRDLLWPSRQHRRTTLGMYYYLLFEALAPAIELLGYVSLALQVLLRHDSLGMHWWSMLLLVVGLAYLVNAVVIFAHQEAHPLAQTPREFARLWGVIAYETFFMRFLSLGWRLRASLQVLRKKDKAWGTQTRRGFSTGQPSSGSTGS